MTSQQARLALREAGIEWKSDATGDVQRIRLTGKQLSDDVLVHLSRFKTDQKLIVHVEGAGEKEVRRLQAMLPRVPVISEESGYLGIAMAASKNRCVVSHALPDTPAEQAGLKTADIITSVNRQQIGNNQDLLYLISRLKPGEKIQLDINRNGRPRQVEVVLGRRTLR